MKLGIVIPVYNERTTLASVVARVQATPPPVAPGGEPLERTLFIIDDGSTDGTGDEAERLNGPATVVLRHERNRGKGAAVRTGIEEAKRQGVDALIIQDADLEYSPDDHSLVLAPILEGVADAVVGSRFIGPRHRVLYYWHYLANRFLTAASNAVTNINLTDMECCLKAFSRDVLDRLEIKENRFGLEPEIVARLARMRLPRTDGTVRALRIYEVAVNYDGRTYAEGKKITWRDGVSALRCIVKYGLLGG